MYGTSKERYELMKILGFFLVMIAAVIIFYNTVIIPQENEHKRRTQPIKTILSLGTNLKDRYTFKPPYTGFEIFVVITGIVGCVMLFWPTNKNEKQSS